MVALVTVNGAILRRGPSGSARVTEHLLAALRSLPDVTVQVVQPRSRRHRSSVVNAIRDTGWDLHGAAHSRPGAVHVSPCNVGRGRRHGRHVLFVHDVMVLDHPDEFDAAFVRWFGLLMPASLRGADAVLTTSERTRARLLRLCPTAEVHVVPLPATRPVGAPRASPPAERTVLMVGAGEPHKNQLAGIRAVAALRAATGLNVRLRHIGPSGRAEPALRAERAARDPAGIWAARETTCSDVELMAAYDGAWVLLQPSLDEGFGLPLVEAAVAGLPVLHSGRGAMNEVMPAADVGSTAAEAFIAPLTRLLDDRAWSAASATVRSRADAFDADTFTRAVHAAVGPLLAAPVPDDAGPIP